DWGIALRGGAGLAGTLDRVLWRERERRRRQGARSFHRVLNRFRSNNAGRDESGLAKNARRRRGAQWSAAKREWRARFLRANGDRRESVGRGVGEPWVEQCSKRRAKRAER